MKAYRVEMNDETTQFLGSAHEPLGIYYRHLFASSESQAKEIAEERFFGSCINLQEKHMTDPELLVKDMIDGQSYEVIADSEHTNDTVIFVKNGSKITSTIRGGDFTESGMTHWYDLSIINDLEFIYIDDTKSLTLRDLEWINAEVYTQVTGYVEIPQLFKGKADKIV